MPTVAFTDGTAMEMQSRMIRTLIVQLSLGATCFLCSSVGFAQQPNAQWQQARADRPTHNHVLSQGLEYERDGKWGEALSLYQQALRKSPESKQLLQRRTIARIHFDLERRYGDRSFLKTISATTEAKSLDVYAEILLKIQSYYVDTPNWTEIANYGLASLETALNTDEFVQKNLPGTPQSNINQAIQTLRQSLANYQVNSRQDAYAVAVNTAKMMRQHLNLSGQATTYEFVCGAISSLDPYSAFMSSNQYGETMSQIEGNFVGLGVELRTHPDHLEIVSVIAKGPAGVAGIRKGDRIVSVDRKSVIDVGSERAADLLRGVENSYVTLSVNRDGVGDHELQLQRRRVEIPSVDQVQIIDQQAGIGYIQLTNFQKTTSRDFDEALWQLHRQNMKALIVDLRGNPGGLLSAAVEVADRFVGAGVIVSTRGRNPLEDFTHRAQMGGTWRVPLTVLIDENSASASEIFAAAIRDHKRGTIVGTQSYGKGSVQGIFPLNVSGGGVRLTTAKFYSPEGVAISQVGVKPDVQVQIAAKPGAEAADVDRSLDMAIRVAKQMVQPTKTVAGR